SPVFCGIPPGSRSVLRARSSACPASIGLRRWPIRSWVFRCSTPYRAIFRPPGRSAIEPSRLDESDAMIRSKRLCHLRSCAGGPWIAPLFEWLGETDRSFALLESARAFRNPSPRQDGILSTDGVHGWILVRRRRVAKGLAILRESSRTQQRLGLHSWLPLTLSW